MRKLFGKKMNKELGGFVRAWENTVKKSQSAVKKSAVNAFFPGSAVAHAADVEEDGGNTVKVLPSGDMYDGRWVENLPHGQGKYLWTDGCMYVGEWFRGKTMGKGRFSWPSGATYEGEFKSGYMDGQGTYTGMGGTYKGSWVMNLKHGKGKKHYSNGDYYDGEWRRGVQEGQGRYQWNNGNHYIGHWKSGSMNGNGTLIWTNGNRYDGYWEDGFPKGNGTLRLEDGGFYVGVWNKDVTEPNGAYYPSGREAAALDWNPHELVASELEECEICPCEKIVIYPSEKVLDWPGIEGNFTNKIHSMLMRPSRGPSRGNDSRPRRLSVDDRLINGNIGRNSDADVSADVSGTISDGYYTPARDTEEGMGNIECDDFESCGGMKRYQVRIPEVKRQGETICKGHKNYELMLNLQLGIRHSVGRPAPSSSLDLKSSAFDPKEKVWTKFPSEGSKHTPPHQSCEFKWKDYCPLVFRTLRKLFKVDPADYMISLCGNDALRELSSPGKSGSFFYLTNDDKYMIKTMKKSEVKVMIKMLPAYYKHVRDFENTLVTRFFGLHCVKLTGTAQKKVRFVIMGNLFCAAYPVHRRFDLKGSSHGRITVKPEEEIQATTTLKDLDLNFFFRLQKDWFHEFCRQVEKDCEFLEQEGIMDYSLLVGLHFRHATSYTREETPRRSGVCTPSDNGDLYSANGTPQRLSRADLDQLPLDSDRLASMTLGINMPARAEQMIRRGDNELQLIGEPTGEFFDVVIFFGIIDILQDYDISKKLEHAYKSIHHDSTSISSVDPKQYSKRFRDFILKVFADDS